DRLLPAKTFGSRPVWSTVENEHRSARPWSDRIVADVIDRIARVERRLDAIDAWQRQHDAARSTTSARRAATADAAERDVAAMRALAGAVGDHAFQVRDVLRHAQRVDPELRAVLDAAGLRSGRRLARWL